ncbi:hypothetical protein DSM112329_02777 [Paraconexibacter sp. AEG42_29]|uniref:Uncharacterized protein n=1 Tax=Paraconexibacter sp. AEG42_29 TaxID=2997339 RepID=A0AAU7AWC4_9ACTN
MRARRTAGIVAAAVALGLGTGCGEEGDDGGRSPDAAAFAARYLPAGTDAAATLDLDYDGPQWQALKTLYARVAKTGALPGVLGIAASPPTLDGALDIAARFVGLSFTDDIEPLLGGHLVGGAAVTPAPALPPDQQRIVERVDPTPVFDENPDARGRGYYVDRSGRRVRDLPEATIRRALTAAADSEPTIDGALVYRVPDTKALDRVLEKLEKQGLSRTALPGVKDAVQLADGLALAGGDTLVLSLSDDDDDGAALSRILAGRGVSAALLPRTKALLDVRLQPDALGALLDSGELTRAKATPPGRALRRVTATLGLDEDGVEADARVDFDGLPASRLPLPAARAVDVPTGVGLGSGSADQSLTTVFLARLVRAVYPDSDFVEAVEALEADTGLTFETGVLQQFSGPSQSLLMPTDRGTTEFAARSSLRDPAAMRKLLPTLVPRLPAILDGLNGLGSTGLAGLLLVAPDAPLVPEAASFLGAVTLKLIGGDPKDPTSTDELLYSVSGVDAAENVTGADGVVYGVIGDVFVVASSKALARKVAAVRTSREDPAATRLQFDVGRLLDESGADPEERRLLEALVEDGELAASARGGDIVASAEVDFGD